MGRGYVDMHKIKENDDFVWYSFETPVFKEGLVDFSKGSYRERGNVFMAVGHCKLNKHTGEFILDTEKTDPYFSIDKFWVGAVYTTLYKIYKSGAEYPAITGWAG